MNLTKIVGRLFCIMVMCIVIQAHANEQGEIKQLVANLYTEKVNAFYCWNADGEFDKKLITVSQSYFSSDFMKYYESVCLKHPSIWLNDIRTGGMGFQDDPDAKIDFTNLNIGQPKITGNSATIRTTYDLPVASYESYGNYTVFKLIKESGQWKIDDIELGGRDPDKDYTRQSVTGLVSYKSVKQYLKKSLKEAAKKK